MLFDPVVRVDGFSRLSCDPHFVEFVILLRGHGCEENHFQPVSPSWSEGLRKSCKFLHCPEENHLNPQLKPDFLLTYSE